MSTSLSPEPATYETKNLQSFDNEREMFTVLSEPIEVIVEKKLYMEIGIDEPERTRFMSASWISGASTISQLSPGASRVQAAEAKWVESCVTSSSNTS